MKKHMGFITVALALLGFVQIAQAEIIRGINMDFVNIGNAGNLEDIADYGSHGAVSYNYHIAKYEVTIAQFTTAYIADSRIGNGNEDYWDTGGRSVGTDAPASQVSWFEAATFCNWLTSGDAYSGGAYQFDGTGSLTNVLTRAQILANGGLFYVLPTEDEWYKAAYFDASGANGYSLYANGSDSYPVGGTNANPQANYMGNDEGYVNEDPNWTWAVGTGGIEQNGTYDMMGNVEEWMENSLNDDVVRGGYYFDITNAVSAAGRASWTGGVEDYAIGFRVASVPEPAVVSLLLSSGLMLLGIRRFFGSEEDNPASISAPSTDPF